MKKTLLSRLIVCYLLATVSIFVLLNTFGMKLLEQRLTKDREDLLYQQAHLISSQYMTSFFDQTMDANSLTKQLQAMDNYLDIRIWIVDSNGLITIDSDPYHSAKNKNINVLDPTFLEKTISSFTYNKDFFNEPMYSVIRPLQYQYRIRGYVVLHTSLSGITEGSEYYLNVINLCFLVFLPLLFLIFFYIYYITERPLKRLMKAAMEYSAGNYDFTLAKKGPAEYRDLGNAITYMAGELSNLDDYQKKFVANISHDFRSPLTSIKGYAEAILDGTIPHEMQDKYLGIILFETERLNKLTSSLLTLNSFEHRGAFLDITTFDINHVIKKTAETFEGSCKDKKIILNLVFSNKETLVDADISKIQQVMYNLIDNAIKFSHNNSKIKVSTEEKGDKVFIAVKDYGIGIPKDSIKKIWDRFYKTDASRGKDKRGTGLGLSITKEIIQAHNENINVISTEGVGTEFVFSLSKAPE
ncbi:MAG: hypothetical protein K0S47_1613 [Herbinix sp.]|jgi:signal transduction histidine kinase|nr:hypothetical protein [Herbinix sp.]